MRIAAALVCAAALLAGCGGGGGGTSSGAGSPSSAPASTAGAGSMPSSVTVDPSVPQSAVSAVAKVVSPLASGALNGSIAIPTASGGGESPLLALDASGRIVLGAMASSSTTTLSVASTALVLVRLVMGPLPAAATSAQESQVDQDIQAAAGFANLEAQLAQALAAGTVPQTSKTVLEGISTVINQVTATEAARAGSGQRAKIATVASPSATTPPPYTALRDSFFAIQLTGIDKSATNSGSVQVTNTMPIYWAVTVTDQSGQPLRAPPPSADGDVLLPYKQISLIGLFVSPTTVAVPGGIMPGAGDLGLNLQFHQTTTSQVATWTQIVWDSTMVIMGSGPLKPFLQPCAGAITQAILSPVPLAQIVTQQPSASVMFNYLSAGVAPNNWNNIGTAIANCATGLGTAQIGALVSNFPNFFGAVTGLLSAYVDLSAAVAAGGLAAEVWEEIAHQEDLPTTVGVCEVSYTIANCTATLQISDPPLPPTTSHTTIPLNGLEYLTVTAFDSTGKSTLMPPDLVWTSSNPAVASVSQTGLLTAGTQSGSTLITVEDPMTGVVSALFTVNVGSRAFEEWTWLGGGTDPDASYGTQGVAAAGNIPGGRTGAATWIDGNGALWLFGGWGSNAIGLIDKLNDLWEYSGGQWTWVGGSSTVDAKGFYGTGPAASNIPGARQGAASWTDSAGNFWLYGGLGYDAAGALGNLTDLWEYSGGVWTWNGGSIYVNAPAVYGTQGVAAISNMPGGRQGAAFAGDRSGNLWLFGGLNLNDLWEYSPATGLWTWVSGSSTAGAGGVYGTQGVTAPNNVPGFRSGASLWVDASGTVWLFGGSGTDGRGDGGPLNDLWKYSGGQWTWVAGSNVTVGNGVYGTQDVASPANTPGARSGASAWTDASGNLWLFGGIGLDSAGATNNLNDVWEFSAGQWMWVSGPNTGGAPGSTGTLGVPSPTNAPRSRSGGVSWIDPSGNLWLFGGTAASPQFINGRFLNDLWTFTP